jgi:L-ribulose-5-phosphate 3-epimerase UlaE
MSLAGFHGAARELLEAERLCLDAHRAHELHESDDTMRRLVSAQERLRRAEQVLASAGVRVIRA